MRAILTVACLCSLACHAATPLLLGLGDQATPPYKLGEATLPATLPGVAVELLQLAAANCDVALRIKLLPGTRMLKELENGDLDGAGLLSYTAERARCKTAKRRRHSGWRRSAMFCTPAPDTACSGTAPRCRA